MKCRVVVSVVRHEFHLLYWTSRINAIFKKIAELVSRMATETVSAQQITEELKAIREDLEFIKTHMFDPDTIMTIEEGRRFEQAMQELREGKTTPLSELKKELGL